MSPAAGGERVIRPALGEDLDAIAAIYAHYVEQSPATFDTEPGSPEQWALKWADACEQNQPWLISERDGELHGYALASTFNPRPAYRFTVASSIYLRPQAVGRGLGPGLYEALLSEIAQRGFHRAIAGITLPNERSVRLHEALSFRPVGVLREVGYKFGAWQDVGWWDLAIETGR